MQMDNMHHHHHPPPPSKPLLDHDPSKPKALLPISFTNGTLKKHHHHHHLYKECLKNHAASLGGYALDGCREFMPSPNSNPAIPTSLTCAACGCHRNFHRRHDTPDENGDGEEEAQMLMALRAGHHRPIAPEAAAGVGAVPRKRLRTKFSSEQKEKMLELSERLGWRLQRGDEAVVEDCCRQIGVAKGVFKVWMYNNKHNFSPSSTCKRRQMMVMMVAAAAPGGGESNEMEGNGEGRNGNGIGNNGSAVKNGSSSSSFSSPSPSSS